MQEKRRNIRVPHEGSVTINAEGRTFPGKVVDVSRNGMKVVAYMPVDHRLVQSVTFNVPRESNPLDIPCQVARLENEADDRLAKDARSAEGGAVLGLQFSFRGEAQLLLVERFIREQKAREVKERSIESRLVPRAACDIREVECTPERDAGGPAIESIADISTEGMLVYFRGELKSGDSLSLRFRLPGDSRPLKTTGRVSYIVHNEFRDVSAAGLRFEGVGPIDQTRIHNYILASATSVQATTLFSRLEAASLDEEFIIEKRPAILALFRRLSRRGLPVNLLKEKSFSILEMPIAGLDAKKEFFSFKAAAFNSIDGFHPDETVNCSFYLSGGTYYFSSKFLHRENGLFHFGLPNQVTRCEKRGYGRKTIGKAITVFVDDENAAGTPGTLIDISRRGFLCEVDWSVDMERKLKPGRRIGYSVEEALGLFSNGLVRHVSRLDGGRLRFGVEAGLHGPGSLRRKKYSPANWNIIKLYDPHRRIDEARFDSRAVRFPDGEGHHIAALVNATAWNTRADVVVIPPAFGKKKEALAGLAATFVHTWRAGGRDVAVVRYDGVNRPGESSNEEMHPKRGYEMLGYRLSRGRLDLEAVLSWVRNNTLFTADRIVLVTFSMSALDARKQFLRSEGRSSADAWISVMGVPAAQGALCRTLGGIDVISNRRMGIANGVCGLLGHLIDMDTLADDAIEQKYAFLTDARLDMARVAIPVVWIHGTHDRWIDPSEIRDIMSIQAPGARELIEVPTGHALRASEDALKVFRLIASSAWRHLFASRIRPIVPTREGLALIVTEERERLEQREKLEKESYWRDYLIGKDPAGAGYDFFANLRDFVAFLDREVELLDLAPGLAIADMGCGTGLLLERLLGRCIRLGSAEVTAVDLVPEALDKAATKAAKALASDAGRNVIINFERRNLEPSRLEPLRRFLARPDQTIGVLRGRIEGLTSSALDRLADLPADLLEKALRANGAEGEIGLADAIERLGLADHALLKELREAALLASKHAKNNNGDFKLLNLGEAGQDGPVYPERSFDRIAASLFISYIFNPDYLIEDFFRMLRPGGLLLVSSMRPDSDISVIFTDFIREFNQEDMQETRKPGDGVDHTLQGARSMLNEAAGLFELEEEGYFRFFSAEELEEMLIAAGFVDIRTEAVLGSPTQAVIAVGRKP